MIIHIPGGATPRTFAARVDTALGTLLADSSGELQLIFFCCALTGETGVSDKVTENDSEGIVFIFEFY